MVQKSIVFVCLSFLFFSCKATKIVDRNVSDAIKVEEIAKGHYANFSDFETLTIKADANYEDAKNKQGVNVDIRIKKDEIIWLNVKLLGFPLAKAMITPSKVSYYEKINKSYFEGNFEILSNWLGTDLDFEKVQNLLLGKSIETITKEKFIASIIENTYQLKEKNANDIQKQFIFEPETFLLKKESIDQVSKNRNLNISYTSFQKVETSFFPREIQIEAQQKDKVFIEIEYKKIELNEKLTFPFSIPEDYEKVTIKD